MKNVARSKVRTRRVAIDGIIPYIWFEDQAEEAATFYTSLFRNSRILEVGRYGEEGPGKAGGVMTVEFELAGQPFIALNGGRQFERAPAVSMLVTCGGQRDVDALWDRLSKGGKKSRCGWLTDRFGLTWQIVPRRLRELFSDKDEERAGRVMAAMLKMSKIEIVLLEKAYRGERGTPACPPRGVHA